jgi:hypothetical protein
MDSSLPGDQSKSERQIRRTMREVLLEQLVTGRECGSCVACCKVLKINKPELQKAADVLCPHNTGSGCGIYAMRPAICRTWYCLWRRLGELPDFLRPDKCGVMFSLDQHRPPRNIFERLCIVARAIDDDPSVFDNGPIKIALKMFAEEGSLPVWLSLAGNKSLYYPPFGLADAIARPSETPFQSLVIQALAWRKRYGVD